MTIFSLTQSHRVAELNASAWERINLLMLVSFLLKTRLATHREPRVSAASGDLIDKGRAVLELHLPHTLTG